MLWRISFQLIPLIALAAAVVFGIRPLRLPRCAWWITAVAFAIAFSKFAVFAIVGGDAFTPDLPAPVIWFLGWIYGAAMIFTAFACAVWVLDLVALAIRRQVGLGLKRWRAAALAVAAVAISLYGVFEGVRTPSVHRVEIFCSELPAAFDGYRIVHLSDLHCSSAARKPRFEAIVAHVNALEPDLVAITGDFVDGKPRDRFDDIAPIGGIRARDGVVGCTGNHEMYWNWNRWRGRLEGLGIVFLEEVGAKEICRGEAEIAVGGIPDRAFFWNAEDWSAANAFAGVPEGAFKVLLCHRPFTTAIAAEKADVRLQLSGHTHGGAMPFLGWLVAKFNEGRLRGIHEFAPGRWLHISPGTGQWAGFPLRLLNPAEITEITLRHMDFGSSANCGQIPQSTP